MSNQGNYDPNNYTPGDYANYPQPATDPLYQPGMYWVFSVGGTFDGQPVAAGDRCYVEGRARQYGDADYGDLQYGNDAGANWSVFVVSFVVWEAEGFPWLQDPPLSGGCPLTGDWRFHVEWLKDERVTPEDGNFEWLDLTSKCAQVNLTAGADDGRMIVPVEEVRLVFKDVDEAEFPNSPSATNADKAVGDRVRVGLSDASTYYPLAVGRVDEIRDTHDTPPRVVEVSAYGQIVDTAVLLLEWNRPEETALSRIEAVKSAIEWNWSEWEYDETPGPILRADGGASDLSARQSIDQSALSSLWSVRTDRRGSLRLYKMPYNDATAPSDLFISDCKGTPPAGWNPSDEDPGAFAPGVLLASDKVPDWTHFETGITDLLGLWAADRGSLGYWLEGDRWIVLNDGYIGNLELFTDDILMATGPGKLRENNVRWLVWRKVDQDVLGYHTSHRIEYVNDLDEMLNEAVATDRPPDGSARPRMFYRYQNEGSSPPASGDMLQQTSFADPVFVPNGTLSIHNIGRDGIDNGSIIGALDVGDTIVVEGQGSFRLTGLPNLTSDVWSMTVDQDQQSGDHLAIADVFVEMAGHSVTSRDQTAIDRVGTKPATHGFPITDLPVDVTQLQTITDAYQQRYSRIIKRVDAVEFTTQLDLTWLAVVAQIDYGQMAEIHRIGINYTPLIYKAAICGWEIVIEPGAMSGAIHLTGATQTTI